MSERNRYRQYRSLRSFAFPAAVVSILVVPACLLPVAFPLTPGLESLTAGTCRLPLRWEIHAALEVLEVEGTNVSRLTDLTGYPKEFIAAISLNMREAGLWVEDGVCYEHWFEGDLIKPVDICCDVMVTLGKLITLRRDGGKIWYKAVRPC